VPGWPGAEPVCPGEEPDCPGALLVVVVVGLVWPGAAPVLPPAVVLVWPGLDCFTV
jgi:hypothetical protein